jgi:aryl-alcohol dehydrogenase-like predicted oxidoreductase
VETIDLYQVHWPNPDPEIEEGWAAMARLVEQGKVRYAAVSNFSVEQMKRAQKNHPITALQPPYSMVDRAVEREILPFCVEHDIGVVAYSPLQSGLLTGKLSRERLQSLDAEDWRHGSPSFQEPNFTKTLELVERLTPVAASRERTVAQLAIAWLLRRPEVTSAIVGARRPEQIEETAPAGDWALAGDDLEEIDRILEEVAVPQPRPLQ